MVNYDNGKIYKIIGGSKTYIGSTTKKYLSQRWSHHKSDYLKKINKTSAWLIFDEIGIEKCNIVLIENYPCKTIDELKSRERYYIEKEDCVNKTIPGRTKEEYNATYRIETNERAKKWYVNNKEKKKNYDSQIIKCSCGYTYTRGNQSRHLRSKRHTGI